jgi:hypothetical protein
MADLALERKMIIDDSRSDARGEQILTVLPWQYVVYDGGGSVGKIAGLEPVDYTTFLDAARDPGEKQIRGMQSVSADSLFTIHGVAGHVSVPTG